MYKNFFKRFIDIVLSLIAIPFLLIELVFIAPVIYFTDKGPVFYNAERVGKNQKMFKMYKLRTMQVNAPDLRNDDGSTYNGDDDPRVTKIGKFLRKTSFDETPQFINVLKGDMSLIGPRPTLVTKPYEDFKNNENREKHYSVRPGITGYSQAYFRNSITQEEKFANDAFYADNITFIFDLKILFKTITSVIAQKNINANEEVVVKEREKVETTV